MRIKNRRTLAEYKAGIVSGDRRILSQALTLAESTRADDQEVAEELIDNLMPFTGNALRIGVSGVPGVGKSTFIDRFGEILVRMGKMVAVLTVDPSSEKSSGSILGDKTRMENLTNSKQAFIRPSPSSGLLGGVSPKTRECMLLCEAAGYNVILVETVGIGQSETAVKAMVDVFLLLALAGAGDELQGIKKGVMEIADLLVINKADGENKRAVSLAKGELKEALHYASKKENGWVPEVMTCSALLGEGLLEIWEKIENYERHMRMSGLFEKNRSQQRIYWMKQQIHFLLQRNFYANAEISKKIHAMEELVESGQKSSLAAAKEMVATYLNPNRQ